MANTTWSTTDKTGTVTLSGSNLIATATSAGAWVRAAHGKTTGKFYWEVTPTVWASSNTGIGITTPTSTPNAWNAAHLIAIFRDGWLYHSGSGVIALGYALVPGDTIGFALDCDAQRFWVRKCPAGTWNQSGSGADPATGFAGYNYVAGGTSGAAGLFPVAEFTGASDVARANFGDTAFVCTVPAGFTAGLPGAASAGSSARVMVLA